jgi:SAM-dependent methyltransferase
VTDPSTAVRALSFGGVADAYDRYRPGPPVEAVDWVLPTGAVDALDLGAGTGALTRVLVQRLPGRVVAAEPDARMRAVLARRSPSALPVGARAEALPFADRSFDAVVVSSAWHWMDPARTLPEVARILRPGGRLGLLWNGPTRDVPWVADLLGRRNRTPRPAGEDGLRHRVELPAGAPFSSPETTVITWSKPTTAEELVGLAGTYSRVITRPAEERAEFLARVEQLAATHPAFAGGTTVELPMACRCWRATRL